MSKRDLLLSANLQGVMEGLDEVLKELLGERMCIVLVAAPFGQPVTQVQYVTNAQAEQSMHLLKVLLDRWEAGVPDVPVHEMQ